MYLLFEQLCNIKDSQNDLRKFLLENRLIMAKRPLVELMLDERPLRLNRELEIEILFLF